MPQSDTTQQGIQQGTTQQDIQRDQQGTQRDQQGTHHDVFLSYSSANKPVADAACAALEARGLRCWIAPRDIRPSQDWSDAIIDAIADCRVFVLILSNASNLSEQVKREVQNAVSEGKPILPMRIEEVSLSKHMRYFIGTPHWLDALTPPLEDHLRRMAQTIQGLLDSMDTEAGKETLLGPDLPVPPPRAGVTWDPKRLATIEAELSRFVGPISATLVREASVTAKGYQALCHQLAEDVLPERERQAFLKKCLSNLPHALEMSPPAPLSPVPPAFSETPATPETPPAPNLDPELLAAATRVLAGFVGPLAKVLVRQAAQAASDQNDFYRRLSEQVSSPPEKADLLRQLKR